MLEGQSNGDQIRPDFFVDFSVWRQRLGDRDEIKHFAQRKHVIFSVEWLVIKVKASPGTCYKVGLRLVNEIGF